MTKTLKQIDESTFDNEVLNADLPVLVDFYADWCGPCKAQQPVLEQVADDFDGRARVVKVNVDQNQALARQFGVRSIPTLLVFSDGEVVASQVGLSSSAALSQLLEEAA